MKNIGSAALRRTKMHHRHPASYPHGGRTSRRVCQGRHWLIPSRAEPEPVTAKGVTMSRRISLSCILFLLSTAGLAQGQPSNSANKYFEQGTRESNQGDFDRAIADFTKAIEISSQPMHHKQDNDTMRTATNSFSNFKDE